MSNAPNPCRRPAMRGMRRRRRRVAIAAGPGTELKRLLRTAGFKRRPGCRCDRRARWMDRRGTAWCRRHQDVIVGWLREEARRCRLPFSVTAARQLVRLAIVRAEKKGGPS